MTTAPSDINKEDFSEYTKALKDYKNTGYKQTISIIQILKNADLTAIQLETFLPGGWSQFVQKINPENDEEQKIKESMTDLLDTLHTQHRKMKSSGLGKMKKKSLEKYQKESIDVAKENLPQNYTEMKNEESELHKKSEHPHQERKHSHSHHQKEEEVPANLNQIVRDFAIKDLSEELATDYKSNKHEKETILPLAHEKAIELEKAIEQKAHGDENKFRLEARNVSAFLSVKNNEGLRKGLLSGDIDAKEFVQHKEDFLSNNLKAKIDEKEREAFNDGNLDRDVEITPESELYKCENCGSRKIEKTEKQMKLGSQSSTSVLVCAECDHVQILEG